MVEGKSSEIEDLISRVKKLLREPDSSFFESVERAFSESLGVSLHDSGLPPDVLERFKRGMALWGTAATLFDLLEQDRVDAKGGVYELVDLWAELESGKALLASLIGQDTPGGIAAPQGKQQGAARVAVFVEGGEEALQKVAGAVIRRGQAAQVASLLDWANTLISPLERLELRSGILRHLEENLS